MSRKTIALVLLVLAMAGPLAAERVALVIGNGAYGGEMPPLPNPGNDARAMAAKLRGLGFSVVEGTDLDRSGFFSKMKEFSRRAEGAEAALLFYAGHGVQADGKNYLIPVSMETLEDKTDLRADAVNLDYVLEQMKGRTNLVFLDACRNNPLTRGLSRSGSSAGGGLAMISAESMGGGVLIGYATQPDAVASDGSGRNSPYTEALLKHLGTPGESAGDMLTRVKADVEDVTGGKQHPWMNASLRAPFYFVPGSAGAVVGPSPPVSMVEPGGCDTELLKLSWDAVKDSRNDGELEAFIADHQSCRGAGVLVARARNLLEDLQQAPVLKAGSRFRDCDACPEMVVVPAGSFLMGSPESEMGRYDNEGPQHRVMIGEAFAVGVYEVTRDEYGTFVAETGHAGGSRCYAFESGVWKEREGADWRSPEYAQTGRDPVVCVSWEDAQAYVRWLSGKTGEEYRLLSEAEWEYAARAESRTRYFYGNDAEQLCMYGNSADQAADEAIKRIGKTYGGKETPCRDGYGLGTAPAGSYRANGFGLHDMHGNVWEWVRDCWNESYAGAPNNGGAWETGECSRRVLRGGSWFSLSRDLRSANRSGVQTGDRNCNIGFRVARTLTP